MSDQMKVPGNTVKNVEERNIPWSQQVDEASYENLASPHTDDTNSAANQSSMQFQYPPFNAKENQDSIWNNYKSRKTPNNFETNTKYGKPGSYNNPKRQESQPNAWGTNNSRRSVADNPGNFNRANRPDDGYISGRSDNKSSVNATFDERKVSAPPATAAAPKKTTWASIASQPAKLTYRTTLTTSSQKKKGPGMPPPPMVPGKHNLDVNTWDLPNNNPPPVPSPPPPIDLSHAEFSCDLSAVTMPKQDLGARQEKEHKGNDFPKDDNKSNYNNSTFGRVRSSPNGHARKNWSVQHPLNQSRQPSGIVSGPARRIDTNTSSGLNRANDRRGHYVNTRSEQESLPYNYRSENNIRNIEPVATAIELVTESPQAVLEELRDKNNYNPTIIDLDRAATARFFIIKSYSEDDIHRSIKYEIWCSTDHGNKRLDDAFKERHKDGGNILLFFSVNGSGHFCGMAQMMTAVDYNSTSSVWSQDKWKGKFKVKWIYVKDVPNNKFRHIRLENNDNKSVTHSRDTQEVPNAKGIEVLQILHAFKHSTSIFDDFYHYEKKQEEEVSSKKPLAHESVSLTQTQSPINRQYNRQSDDRDSGRGGGQQKFFGGNSGGGGGGGGGSSFRERNITTTRGGYHNNFNEHRRFESHRTTNTSGTSDYKQKEKNSDVDRENSEYGNRHAQKFDFNRRDDRTQNKHNNRERDLSEDTKSDARFRTGPRETQKDNEYPTAERSRVTDY